MSSVITNLYQSLVDQIICVCRENKLEGRLRDLDLENDLSFIFFLFTDPINKISKPFAEWQNEEWIESMNHVQLGLLSFLYKQRITLGNIYKLGKPHRIEILQKYRDLIINLRLRNIISRGEKVLIEEVSSENDFANKTTELIFSFKRDYKDPKNISLLIDLLSIEYYRKKIISAFTSGAAGVNVDLNESDQYAFSLLSNTFSGLDKTKLLSILMRSNLKGSILINKTNEHSCKDYIRKVIQESVYIQELKREINADFLNASGKQSLFKNNIKYVYLEKNFLKEYEKLEHLNICAIDFDKISLEDSKKIYYTFFDLQHRITCLCFYLLEQINYMGVYYHERKSDIITELIVPRLTTFLKYIGKTTASKVLNTESSFKIDSIGEFFSKIKNIETVSEDDILSFCKQFGIEITPEYKAHIKNFINNRNSTEDVNLQDLSFLENAVITNLFKAPIHISQELFQDFKQDVKQLLIDLYQIRSDNITEFHTFQTFFSKFLKYMPLIKCFVIEIFSVEKFDEWTGDVYLFQKNPKIRDIIMRRIHEIYLVFFKDIEEGNIKKDEILVYVTNIGKTLDKGLLYINGFQKKVKELIEKKKKVVVIKG